MRSDKQKTDQLSEEESRLRYTTDNQLYEIVRSLPKEGKKLSEDERRILEVKYRIMEENRLRICQMHPEWPRTLEEAVIATIGLLDEEGKKTLLGLTEKELIRCHWALGRRIRNLFGMWTYNIDLLCSCGYSTASEAAIADEASMVIIKAVWKRLREMKGLPADYEE